MSSNVRAARGKLTASMLIFGTIGLFVRWIPLPSASIAFARALIGALFLAAVQLIRRQPFAWADIRRNIVRLLISGVLMGFNWILLFESYRYTTVAVATLCYYLAPVFVLMAAPLLLHEHWTRRKALCIAAAHWRGWCWYPACCKAGRAALHNIAGFCWPSARPFCMPASSC